MGSKEFRKYQDVWNEKGQRAQYIGSNGPDYLVKPYLVVGGLDDEFEYLGDREVWKQAYDKPPMPKVSLAVVAIVLVVVVGLWLA